MTTTTTTTTAAARVVTHSYRTGRYDVCRACEERHGMGALVDSGIDYLGVHRGLHWGTCDHPRHAGGQE